MSRLKSIAHDDQLTVVEHLTELRFRTIVSVAAFGVALALCFWQNRLLLQVANRPLAGRQPLTLGVGEAFTTTLTVSCYAALLIALPVVLYQLYSFVSPAFAPRERRVAAPLFWMTPFLFLGGALFGYFVVIPAALHFLLHFNADQFHTQIRARDYYGFLSQTLIALGLLFQLPVALLGLTRLGVITPDRLRRSRRYAVVAAAGVAALLPGDVLTMLLEMLPILALYELSILLARAFGRPRATSPAETYEEA